MTLRDALYLVRSPDGISVDQFPPELGGGWYLFSYGTVSDTYPTKASAWVAALKFAAGTLWRVAVSRERLYVDGTDSGVVMPWEGGE